MYCVLMKCFCCAVSSNVNSAQYGPEQRNFSVHVLCVYHDVHITVVCCVYSVYVCSMYIYMCTVQVWMAQKIMCTHVCVCCVCDVCVHVYVVCRCVWVRGVKWSV